MTAHQSASVFGVHLPRATLDLFVGKQARVKTNPPLFTDPRRSIANRPVVLFAADDNRRPIKGVIGIARHHGRRNYELEAQRMLNTNELHSITLIVPE